MDTIQQAIIETIQRMEDERDQLDEESEEFKLQVSGFLAVEIKRRLRIPPDHERLTWKKIDIICTELAEKGKLVYVKKGSMSFYRTVGG